MNESKTLVAKKDRHLDGHRSEEITVRQFSAPIPLPDMLEQYEKYYPVLRKE